MLNDWIIKHKTSIQIGPLANLAYRTGTLLRTPSVLRYVVHRSINQYSVDMLRRGQLFADDMQNH